MNSLVVALAIVLRIAWVLAVPTKPVGDFAMYVESAAHLATHGSFDGFAGAAPHAQLQRLFAAPGD